MSLPFKVSTQAEIPSGAEAFYAERADARAGGKKAWFLDVVGAAPKEAVDEFRTKLAASEGVVSQMQAHWGILAPHFKRDGDSGDLTPEVIVARVGELRSEAETLRAAKSKGGLTPEDLKKAVDTRAEELQAAHKRALEAEKANTAEALKKLDAFEVNSVLSEEAQKAGVKPSMMKAVTALAGNAFEMRDLPNGLGRAAVMVGADGKIALQDDQFTPVGIQSWIEALKKETPDFFESSKGLGTMHSGRAAAQGVPAGVNPWDPKTMNYTQQAQIESHNFELAATLARQHGVILEKPA